MTSTTQTLPGRTVATDTRPWGAPRGPVSRQRSIQRLTFHFAQLVRFEGRKRDSVLPTSSDSFAQLLVDREAL